MKALLEVKTATLRGETKHIVSDSMTIGEWLDIWLEMNQKKWKLSTSEYRKMIVDNRLKKLLGHYRLQKLDRATYQRAFINVLEDKLQPYTLKQILGLFKIAINATVEEKILARNRFTKVVIKDEDDTKTSNKFLTPAELNKLLSTAKETEVIWHYSFLLVAAYTGMQRGEALGLQWKNIDFKNHTITIERTRDKFGARTPKTKNSYRTILVDSIVIEQLKKYKTWYKKVCLQYGIKYSSDLFIFINSYGEPVHDQTFYMMLKRVQLQAKLVNEDGSPKISLHGLWHTHATILLNNGQIVKVIGERLGNTPNMVMNTYGHVMKELEQESVNVFSASLATGAKSGAN
ncbi:tyrosine-type recombinase/integrase [Lysinibacillus capsici]|uniref:tyrosine-type recombinase/integrase n=1 Tax=Lysinibacillus capsici TaxID=2115968 RepID=UPI002E22397F|nr:tyrosine-type recombinase/integrase [Lysinibacillus capsici]